MSFLRLLIASSLTLFLFGTGASSNLIAAESQCLDLAPPPGTYSCSQQLAWGKCQEAWMQGYCRASCGTCSSSPGPISCPGDRPSRVESPASAYARYEDLSWMSVDEWCRRVQSKRDDPARGDARVVFIGDSITEGWTSLGIDAWNNILSTFRPLSLGIGGDQTQHLLWRLERGELDGLDPELLVLLIGVNNIGYGNWSEPSTAAGVEAVLRSIRRRLPQTPILHLSILPAQADPSDSFRKKIARTNDLLAQIKILGVEFLDMSSSFLNSDQSISADIMYDYLHPTALGYQRWALALRPEIERRLKEKP